MARVALVLGRADPGAQGTARAVLRRHLNRVLGARKILGLVVDCFVGVWCAVKFCRVVYFDANSGMRADQYALVALDAEFLVPGRDFNRDVAFLPLGSAQRPGAVRREGRNRQHIALVGQHHCGDSFDQIGCVLGDDRGAAPLGRNSFRDIHLVKIGQGRVDRPEVEIDDLVTFRAVGLLDRALDLGDGLVAGQNSGDREEAGLHDRIGSATHAAVLSDRSCIDTVDLEPSLDNCFLHFQRKSVPGFFRREGRVDQEGRPGLRVFKDIVLVQEDPLVAGDKVGLFDQISRANRFGTEAQVGDSDGAGLLRVVDEVALREVVGLFADDFDRVLVGADCAIGTKAEENTSEDVIRSNVKVVVNGQGGVGDIVDDADCEVVLGSVGHQVLEDRLDHGGVEFLG